MQGTNVLFGQIAVVFGILIAGVWGATQWTAAALGYQVRLGSPWFDFLGTPIYHPWKLFERSEEHTSELQSLMRISYAVFCLKKKKIEIDHITYKDKLCHT